MTGRAMGSTQIAGTYPAVDGSRLVEPAGRPGRHRVSGWRTGTVLSRFTVRLPSSAARDVEAKLAIRGAAWTSH